MMAGKHSDVISVRILPLKQLLYISKNLLILVFHVLTDLSHISIVKLDNQKDNLLFRRTADGFYQFSTDSRQLEIQK